MIAYGKQSIDESDIAAVLAALRSDFLTCGPEVEAFEKEMAALAGAKHAVAVCNATAALHLSMLAAEIGPGDRVITSPNTFLASANAAAYVGAIPDFADIDPVSYNLCPNALAARWQKDVKAVVAVDYAGQSADMPKIAELARKHGAIVIEDAAHAVGGKACHIGQTVNIGGHSWADMTILSFHPVKTLTTGEGGMVLTNDDNFAKKLRRLRTHGMERNVAEFEGFGTATGPLAEVGPWVYEMQDLGFNYRITDLQCALGRSQLLRLGNFLQRRRQIVQQYNAAFADVPWIATPALSRPAEKDLTSWHLYTVQINFSAISVSRTEVMTALRTKGVGTQVLYIPVHLQPYYRKHYGYGPGYCPVAESFYSKALSLPLYPAMSDQDVNTVIEAVCALSGSR